MIIQTSGSIRLIIPSSFSGGWWLAEDYLSKKRYRLSQLHVRALISATNRKDSTILRDELVEQSGISLSLAETALQTLLEKQLLIPPGASIDRLESINLLRRFWAALHLEEAAEYHLATLDYPFVDYSRKSGRREAQDRMRGYSQTDADLNRTKSYPNARLRIVLPPPSPHLLPTPIDQFWQGRCPQAELSRERLGAILSAAFGKVTSVNTTWEGAPLLRRTSPSGGSRHPTEGYLLCIDVEDLPSGWYHIGVDPPRLEFLTGEIPQPAELARIFDQSYKTAQFDVRAIVVLTAMFERNMYRYREPRTFRTVHMDTGHLASTIQLCAASLGINQQLGYDSNPQNIESKLLLDGLEEGYFASVALGDGVSKHSFWPEVDSSPAVSPTAFLSERWSPLTVFRPPMGPDDENWIVSDSLLGRRESLPSSKFDTLLEMWADRPEKLLSADSVRAEVNTIDVEIDGAVRHWWERGWHPSLEYYLWSRHPSATSNVLASHTALRVDHLPAGSSQISATNLVSLSRPAALPDVTLGEVLFRRRTARSFAPVDISIDLFSSVLWNGFHLPHIGHSHRSTNGFEQVSLSGFDIIMVVYNVRGLRPGIYRYFPATHSMTTLLLVDMRESMREILCGMQAPKTAAWTAVLAMDVLNAGLVYPNEAALRSIYLDAGWIAQRVILSGVAYGLGALVTPAFRDRLLCHACQLDSTSTVPVYSLTMGYVLGQEHAIE